MTAIGGPAEPTRLSIDRYWRHEFNALIAGLPQAQIPQRAQALAGRPTT
jgi:hypothetical protein